MTGVVKKSVAGDASELSDGSVGVTARCDPAAVVVAVVVVLAAVGPGDSVGKEINMPAVSTCGLDADAFTATVVATIEPSVALSLSKVTMRPGSVVRGSTEESVAPGPCTA